MIALFFSVLFVNVVLMFFMIFFQQKRPHRIFIWLLVFFALPIIGFLLYILFGVGVFNRKKKLSQTLNNSFLEKQNLKLNVKNELKENSKINLQNNKYFRKNKIKTENLDSGKYVNAMIFNASLHREEITKNESVEIFRDGIRAFEEIINSIRKAKKFIFVQSYIFASDEIGTKILKELVEKAKSGVKVIVLIDSVGSRKLKKDFFKDLVLAGGVVFEYFSPLFNVKFLNLMLNYRNHRKIIIIDTYTCFIGGLNIRDDHLGKNRKLSPWLDTHIKIVGTVGLNLLKVFLSDLKLCVKKEEKNINNVFDNKFFEDFKCENLDMSKCEIRAGLINSSPLNLSQKIEDSFIYLINNALKSIVIETPYLILDEKFFCAIKNSLISGVKVKIILSKIPDKKFVYNASLYYANQLIKEGAEIFLYDGFVHSKTLLVDDKIFVCGSANFDMRSFNLNSETSLIVYNRKVAQDFKNEIIKTINCCEKLELNFYKKLPVYKKLAIKFSKLFSPIL